MSSKSSFRSEIVEAIVQTTDDEVPYRRAGRGRPSLLLCEPDRPDREIVFRRLASLGLVVEPLILPGSEPDWPPWLRNIVDGLGLHRPDLVVSARLAEGPRRFVEGDPHRVGALLLIEELDDLSH